MATVWYLPSLLWRWSLKSTLWLWWPLVLLLREPLEGLPPDLVRDRAAERVYGSGRGLGMAALLTSLWLLLSLWSELRPWVDTVADPLQKPLKLLLTYAPPAPGLRLYALYLCCILGLITSWQGNRLKNMHKQPLEGENDFEELPVHRKALFIERAKHLEFWHTAVVVSFILFGYTVVLWLAQAHYPEMLSRFVPTWLLQNL